MTVSASYHSRYRVRTTGAIMANEQKSGEQFPKDEGEHLPPHGTKPQRTPEEGAEKAAEEAPTPDKEAARQGEAVPDSRKKRRTVIALVVAAIILLILIAIFA